MNEFIRTPRQYNAPVRGVLTIKRTGYIHQEKYITIRGPGREVNKIDPQLEHYLATGELLSRSHCVVSFIEGLMSVGWIVWMMDHRRQNRCPTPTSPAYLVRPGLLAVPAYFHMGELYGLGVWNAYAHSRRRSTFPSRLG